MASWAPLTDKVSLYHHCTADSLEERTSIDPDRLVRPVREWRDGGHVGSIERTRRPTKSVRGICQSFCVAMNELYYLRGLTLCIQRGWGSYPGRILALAQSYTITIDVRNEDNSLYKDVTRALTE